MSDYDHSDAIITSHLTDWTVHVLGPDDVHTFESAQAAADWLSSFVPALARLYPRDSDFTPMIRLVVSPPTGFTVTDTEVT